MTSRIRILVSALLGAAALTAAVPTAVAQSATDHPAVKVVNDYLSMILTRQWKKSADIVDESSMKVLKDDYVGSMKQPGRTIAEEEGMAKRVGKEKLEDVEKMTPREWYAAYNDGLRQKYDVPEEKLAEIRRTIKLKTMSVAEDEGGKVVHILVKAIYSTGETAVERLDLTSLRNNGGKWQVVLDGQAPKITRLKPGAGPAAPPVVDPVQPSGPPKSTRPPTPPVKPKRPN